MFFKESVFEKAGFFARVLVSMLTYFMALVLLVGLLGL